MGVALNQRADSGMRLKQGDLVIGIECGFRHWLGSRFSQGQQGQSPRYDAYVYAGGLGRNSPSAVTSRVSSDSSSRLVPAPVGWGWFVGIMGQTGNENAAHCEQAETTFARGSAVHRVCHHRSWHRRQSSFRHHSGCHWLLLPGDSDPGVRRHHW